MRGILDYNKKVITINNFVLYANKHKINIVFRAICTRYLFTVGLRGLSLVRPFPVGPIAVPTGKKNPQKLPR